MTIQISQDWFNNNISDQEGYTLDSENEVFTKTIQEDDLNFRFSTDADGEFKNIDFPTLQKLIHI